MTSWSHACMSTVYGWLHWITMSMLPFSFVSNTLARRYTKLDPISRTSFMKDMHALCYHVERKISSQLHDKFALVHDGVEADAIKALRDSQASQGSEEGFAVLVLSLAERSVS
ncbi:hypothetical protein DYB38_012163 [Aphanomyces astaci]|uniref:Uncharacterized protein n=1 Tax=Aphanomyces astaci TaxID=112090 RepID=A0A397DUE6_APHAT|nr:hypothetical protein DYB38_012163 [Aphanomyces astaci]